MQDNFDCGRFEDDKNKINQEGEEAPDLEFGINCGATYINDRCPFDIIILPCKSNQLYIKMAIDRSSLY